MSDQVVNHLRILRDEYARLEPVAEQKRKKGKAVIGDSEYISVRINEGARLSILWGSGCPQVVSKFVRHAPYDKGFDQQPNGVAEAGASRFVIVTPSFDSVEYIDKTVLSVITQEGDFSIRFHVQDGGSTDGTLDRLKYWRDFLASPENPLVRCNDVEFSFTSSRDRGMYDAINRGFKATGSNDTDICTWINSDDALSDGALTSVSRILKANPDTNWVIGAVSGFGRHMEEVSHYQVQYPREIIAEGLCEHRHWRFIQQEGSFWTGRLWNTCNGLDSSLRLAGDWDLWRRFAQMTTPVHVMWTLGRFRIHGDQLTANSMKAYYDEIDSIVPERRRKEVMKTLMDDKLDPMRVIERPNKLDDDMRYQVMPLQERYTHRVRDNNQLLRDHKDFSIHDPIRVMTMCTIAYGGAGTGSLRRIEALRNSGVDARLFSLVSDGGLSYVGKITPTLDGIDTSQRGVIWRTIVNNINHHVCGKPAFRGHDFFSLTESLLDFRQLVPVFDQFDIVHLHWVVGMLDLDNMADVLRDKPLVWTTADMNPFTGGCHYSEGCDGFMQECRDCPMTDSDDTVTHDAWRKKKAAYEKLDITLVCPSQYIADLAAKSSLLGDKRIVVIPNAYPVPRFNVLNRRESRDLLDLPSDKRLVLFAAQSVENIRKGGDLLIEVAKRIDERAADIEFMCIGDGDIELPVKLHALGTVKQKDLSRVYSSADVYVSLSREDVGPMTVVESLLCGTPVVGFGIGVMPEVVIDGETGAIIEPYDVDAIVDAIIHFVSEDNRSDDIRKRCRETAKEYAAPGTSAYRHKRLYEELLSEKASR